MERADLTLPACLVIMDGFGLAEPGPGNAIAQARTPNLDALFAERPWTRLEASGEAVGLPEGQMGNSEVGHLNIGAGRVVFQELTRINRACADGSLAANPVLNDAFAAAREPGAALHLMGLVSDGGVHSTNGHLYALARAAREAGVGHIVVHCFMDGRDVPPKSGAGYLEELEAVLAELTDDACTAEIGSISGRYYAMDRDNRWERVEQAWRAVVAAEPCTDATSAEVMAASYAEGVTDEFVVPTALSGRGVQDGDAAVFFNFRPDRAREITRALVDPAFAGFERGAWPQVSFACLTEYDPEIPAPVAFPKEFPDNVLADVLAAAGLRQYHIAET
ncbi:2,3-bisphosphoglycerate-independent phosphoglycerate mutase, partial [Gordonibacter pamelaeae]